MDVENESGLVTKPSKSFVEALAKRKYEKAIALIKSSQLNVNKVCSYDVYRLKPLSLVIKCFYRKDLVQAIIDAGADVNATGWYYIKDRDGRLTTGQQYVTPLYQAVIEESNKDLVLLLIQAGADVNKLTGKSRFKEEEGGTIEFCTNSTCLHHCVSKIKDSQSRCQMLQVLLESAANYSLPNDHGFIPLQISLMEQYSDCVALLVRYGSIGNNLTSSVYSPLAIQFEAASSSNTQILQVLLNGGYDAHRDEECSDIIKNFSKLCIEDSELKDMYFVLKNWLCEPLMLKSICRLRIRKSLMSKCNPNTLLSLPIPKQLQQYLNLCDII
ncbi:hypothetical protein FSP39_017288 [Pinctada imbricata]|uniref:SOCS box domain-containing protein n=1 Tax=Pinctada imbricata TaxID=66713 RepID=A0AA88XL76_PINIB|nr:hypothetical protein FSP39_017288 [Pinctada imbricata]